VLTLHTVAPARLRQDGDQGDGVMRDAGGADPIAGKSGPVSPGRQTPMATWGELTITRPNALGDTMRMRQCRLCLDT
jgi:hypothetical protein